MMDMKKWMKKQPEPEKKECNNHNKKTKGPINEGTNVRTDTYILDERRQIIRKPHRPQAIMG